LFARPSNNQDLVIEAAFQSVNTLPGPCLQIYALGIWALCPTNCREGAAVLSRQCYLILGLVTAAAPIVIVVTAPPAEADCNYAAGATVCAQGTVRGADGVPRAATPVVPYPCEYDWYCDSGWDLDVGWDPGRPGGRGGIGPRR
jgi:hypothetical protein